MGSLGPGGLMTEKQTANNKIFDNYNVQSISFVSIYVSEIVIVLFIYVFCILFQ